MKIFGIGLMLFGAFLFTYAFFATPVYIFVGSLLFTLGIWALIR